MPQDPSIKWVPFWKTRRRAMGGPIGTSVAMGKLSPLICCVSKSAQRCANAQTRALLSKVKLPHVLASVCEAPPYAPPFVVGLFSFKGVSGFVPYYRASNPPFRGNTSSASAALLGRTKKAFIISHRHRITRRANIAVMPPAKI